MTICLFDSYFRVLYSDIDDFQSLKGAFMLVFMSCLDKASHEITTKLMHVVGDAELFHKTLSVFCLDSYSNTFDRLFKTHIDQIHS